MAIGITKPTINDLFTGLKILEIPFFQRAYVWGKEDTVLWDRMLEDFKTVTKSKKTYFMGSVILKQQDTAMDSAIGDVRTVIDGQQRLTTLCILLKVLCLKKGGADIDMFDGQFKLRRTGESVIQHTYNDRDKFNTIMALKELEYLSGDDNITRAYMFYKENLNSNELDFDTITQKILFVGIDLTDDEDEQQIFDTINSLGVRLTTAELLKNYFFGREDIIDYKRYWKRIFEEDDETKEYWDREISTGKFTRSFVELFFYSYLQIKIQEKEYNVSAEDKQLFSKVEKLFDSYKRFIKVYCNNQKKPILEELHKYAEVFRKVFDMSFLDDELPEQAGIERINAIIFRLETSTLIPYVLFVEYNLLGDDNQEKSEIYKFLESYIMRRIVTRETNKNYNQLFTDRFISNRVLTKQALVDKIGEQDEKTNHMPSDSDVATAFNEARLTNKIAAGVLYMIESKIRDRSKQSTKLLGINKYSLEHVMPKKWRKNWGSLSDELSEIRDRKLLTLGNLTIITQSLNSSVSNDDWATKKTGKPVGKKFQGGLDEFANGIEIFCDYLRKGIWDEGVIQERAEFLSEKALEVWNV
jgi:uncharacterized protein with ParB-like and HNH nuclease domain